MKYNFNFILNRTRSGQELFDRPWYAVTNYLSYSNKLTYS